MTSPGERADPPSPGPAGPDRPVQSADLPPAGAGGINSGGERRPSPADLPEGMPGAGNPAVPADGRAPADGTVPAHGTAGTGAPSTSARTVAGVIRRAARVAGEGLTRLVELTLIVIGMVGVFGEWEIEDIELLLLFDMIAVVYLTVGLVVVRRQRRPTPVDRAVLRQRLRFDLLFSVTAALIGLYSAVTVATSDPDPVYAAAITFVGVLTVALSWLLLHAGHARHYRNIYARLGGGLEWPVPTPNPARPPTVRPTPRQIDFVYFAYTIGTSFGASDVMVTERGMRWSVLLHSCLSFFFNAAVLAFLISRLSSM